MDAVKFFKERDRMCRSYNGCTGCPAAGCECNNISLMDYDSIINIIGTVEVWSAANPQKTRQSEFKKLFPNVLIGARGEINICPELLAGKPPFGSDTCSSGKCSDCRQKFWSQEVE